MREFITISEAAEILRVSRSTINRLLASGQLQAAKIRRAVRIPAEAIESLKNARKEVATNE